MNAKDDELALFVQSHAQWMMGLAFTLTRSTHVAEDVVQETLARVVRYWKRIEATENPRSYLRRMIINEVNRAGANSSRRASIEKSVDGRVIQTLEPQSNSSVGRDEELDHILQCLSRDQHTVVVLRLLEDCSYREIAEIVGINENTARSLYSRGLTKMREVVGESTGAENEECGHA